MKRPADHSTVTLLDGLFYESQNKGKEYLIYLDVDRLLAPCYEAVNREPKKPRYGGWESKAISGHSAGHWLSAASTMVAVTGDRALKEKLAYAIDELAHIQSFDSDGYVSGFPRTCFDNVFDGNGDFQVDHFNLGGSWVPWYSIHKIYAGLIDAYNYTGNENALEVVTRLADWAKKGTDKLSDDQFQRMLTCEHGGMNEAMADLYTITGKKQYLDLAIRFCHKAVLEPLSNGIDELEGKHANTQIPKVIGAAKLYEITGDDYYKRMATFFWHQVTKHRSYVIGGNSKDEHFGPENSEKLGIQTTETCNTYNMLKLTEHLFDWSHDAVYMDFYERALYNHILASQDPDSGMKMYFVPTEPGHFKVYHSPHDSFWCCTGTGMENPARYTRSIYYDKDDALYVNLFIASTWRSADGKWKVRQETTFPEAEQTRFVVEEANGQSLPIYVRKPYWVAGNIRVTINGKETETAVENGSGYVRIDKQWQSGDCVQVTLPMNVHTYTAKDDERKMAFMYGPVVLAGALGTENFPESDILDNHLALNNHPLIEVPTLVTEKTDVNEWIHPVESAEVPLTFETDPVGQPGNVRVTLIPFYALHHQRYTLYWDMMDEKTYQTHEDKEKEAQRRLRGATVDEVQPNEQQPEVEHRLQEQNTKADYLNTVHRGWRESFDDGYFRYDMTVEPETSMYVLVTYLGSDGHFWAGKMYTRDFDILIDDTVIARQTLNGDRGDDLFDVCYSIPEQLTKGKNKVSVTFASREGTVAGRVFGVRILRERI